MRVIFITDSDRARNVESLQVWDGDLAVVPRVGEHVTIFEGWTSNTVQKVFYDLSDNLAEVHMPPDYTGEYRNEIERRKDRERTEPGDWTVDPDTGRSNSSTTYLELVNVVEKIIQGEGNALIAGRVYSVARTIVSNLAHIYGMSPRRQS